MIQITLAAYADDDLNWDKERALAQESEQILWKLELGLEAGALALKDPALFQSRMLALDYFVRTLGEEFKKKTLGVVLYSGPLHFLERAVWEEEDEENFSAFKSDNSAVATLDDRYARELFCTQLFAEYMHRLASTLPDAFPAICEFHLPHMDARTFQLLSKARFEHLELRIKGLNGNNRAANLGLLLPPDSHCDVQALELLDNVLKDASELRVIPEILLTEQWDGLDKLLVVKHAVSSQGERKLRGFIAAGGEIEYR